MKLTTERLSTRLGPSAPPFVPPPPFAAASAAAEPLSESVLSQITALRAEKESRSPAQQKMDSQLIYGFKQSLNQSLAPGVGRLRVNLRQESDGRVWVDLKGTITPQLLNDIRAAGGNVLDSVPRFNAARV